MTIKAILRQNSIYRFCRRYYGGVTAQESYISNAIKAKQMYCFADVQRIIRLFNDNGYYSIKKEYTKYSKYLEAILTCCGEHIDLESLKKLFDYTDSTYYDYALILKGVDNYLKIEKHHSNPKIMNFLKSKGLLISDDINAYVGSRRFNYETCSFKNTMFNDIVQTIIDVCSKNNSTFTEKGLINLYKILPNICSYQAESKYIDMHRSVFIHYIVKYVPNNIKFNKTIFIKLFGTVKYFNDAPWNNHIGILDVYDFDFDRDAFIDLSTKVCHEILIWILDNSHKVYYDIEEDLVYWINKPIFLSFVCKKMYYENVDIMMFLFTYGYLSMNTFKEYIVRHEELNNDNYKKIMEYFNDDSFIETVLSCSSWNKLGYLEFCKYMLKHKIEFSQKHITYALTCERKKVLSEYILNSSILTFNHSYNSLGHYRIYMLNSLSIRDRNIIMKLYNFETTNCIVKFNDIISYDITITCELIDYMLLTRPDEIVRLLHSSNKYNYCFEYITYDNVIFANYNYSKYFIEAIIKPYNNGTLTGLCMIDIEQYSYNKNIATEYENTTETEMYDNVITTMCKKVKTTNNNIIKRIITDKKSL